MFTVSWNEPSSEGGGAHVATTGASRHTGSIDVGVESGEAGAHRTAARSGAAGHGRYARLSAAASVHDSTEAVLLSSAAWNSPSFAIRPAFGAHTCRCSLMPAPSRSGTCARDAAPAGC